MKVFAVFMAGLLLSCGTPNAVLPTERPVARPTLTIAPAAPATAVLVAIPTERATTVVRVPIVAADATAPTAAPLPTAVVHVPIAVAPAAASSLGAAPKGSDCPADHPLKGNIVDRGANKGEKIYHLPSSSSYKATKPERCFVDAKEAEAAGYRAPK